MGNEYKCTINIARQLTKRVSEESSCTNIISSIWLYVQQDNEMRAVSRLSTETMHMHNHVLFIVIYGIRVWVSAFMNLFVLVHCWRCMHELAFIIPRACARGKAIGRVVLFVRLLLQRCQPLLMCWVRLPAVKREISHQTVRSPGHTPKISQLGNCHEMYANLIKFVILFYYVLYVFSLFLPKSWLYWSWKP